MLQQFYLQLRKNTSRLNDFACTTRQLDSLIRLAEARAKCELSQTISAEHADDVVEIMKHSMDAVFEDGLGFVDFRRGTCGNVKRPTNRQCLDVVGALQRIAESECSFMFTRQQIENVVKTIGIHGIDIDSLVGKLNHEGYLLKKGSAYELYR